MPGLNLQPITDQDWVEAVSPARAARGLRARITAEKSEGNDLQMTQG